jgi:hypothetical protein
MFVALPLKTREWRMPRSYDDDVKRISIETQAHIISAHASCEQAAEHVRTSKAAVERSLRLLQGPVCDDRSAENDNPAGD